MHSRMTTRLRKFINPIAISPDNRDTPSLGVAPSTVESGGIPASSFAMSTSPDRPQSDTCGYCDGEFSLPNTRPNHCDDNCFYRDKGAKALNQLHSDHRVCSTCYGLVKDVEPAKQHWTPGPDHQTRTDSGPKDISDGLQYPTNRTVWAVDETDQSEYLRIERTRWGCVCGAVNPRHEIAEIQAVDPTKTIRNLWYALVDAFERGAIEEEPRKEPYLEAFKPPWRGAEYAIGKSLYGDQ